MTMNFDAIVSAVKYVEYLIGHAAYKFVSLSANGYADKAFLCGVGLKSIWIYIKKQLNT
jgi:hypothetical protein